METRFDLKGPGVVPVFPLPNTVFFPDTALPLHVFEPRYRAMVRDAVAGDRLIAVALLKPGWEADYYGNPPIHEICTVGRIEDLEPLPDGRFNLRLVGLHRIRLGRAVRSKPYRLIEAACAPERGVDERGAEVQEAKLGLLATHTCLARELLGDRACGPVLNDAVSFASAVNAACATLPVEPGIRQRLLEVDDLLERLRQVSGMTDRLLQQVLEIKGTRSTGGGEPGVN